MSKDSQYLVLLKGKARLELAEAVIAQLKEERDEARGLVLRFRKAVSGDCGLAECDCEYCESLKEIDAALKKWKAIDAALKRQKAREAKERREAKKATKRQAKDK